MSISFRKYIDIVSSVGGGVGVRLRDLIGRLATLNPLIPPNVLIEFTDAESVGAYFGTASEEYERAQFYFSWISKDTKRAQRIGFIRYLKTDSPPRIYGRKGVQSLGAYTSITSGQFVISIGGVTKTVSGLNFSTALSLSDVAGLIEDKIQAFVEPQFATSTVSWDPVRRSFNFVGVANGAQEISVSAGVSNDVASQLGWLTGAIMSDGALSESLTDMLINSTDASNNFGSLLIMDTLTAEEWEEVAQWNTNQNVMFMVMTPVDRATMAAIQDAIISYSGMGITLSPFAEQYAEMIPMIILAATDYNSRAATKNYMFHQFAGIDPSVTTTQDSNELDLLRINYMGVTQTAGQLLAFYQRGVLTGTGNAPTDMNVYANEMWLKDAMGAEIMQLFLNLNKVSANTEGRSQLLTTIQSVVDRALFNGTISVGKPFGNVQKLYIAQLTGDDKAWHQVQGIGYWYDVVLESYVTQDGRTEWKAVYRLVYSKDDVIRKVDGSHSLI